MSKYLFVYGTLLPDEAPAEIARAIRKLRVVGRGRTRGRLYDFGDFPGAVVNPSARSTIAGLVYEIPADPELLRQLDRYEGVDSFHPANSLFLRRKRWITLEDGRRLLSWVYEYNRDPVDGVYLPRGNYGDRARIRKPARIAGD
jgi:gamma-glutamylcyclotransferase (GGCT)/AIG2-like uncharacterized protein YtfP